jgi:hypothetical protein
VNDSQLRDGSYACGRVLQVEGERRKRDARWFLGALLRWHGTRLPTAEAIAGSSTRQKQIPSSPQPGRARGRISLKLHD